MPSLVFRFGFDFSTLNKELPFAETKLQLRPHQLHLNQSCMPDFAFQLGGTLHCSL